MAVFPPLDYREAECEKTRRENVARYWNCLEIEGEVSGLPLPFSGRYKTWKSFLSLCFLRGDGELPKLWEAQIRTFLFSYGNTQRFFPTGENPSWMGEDSRALWFRESKFKEKPTVHRAVSCFSHSRQHICYPNPICKWKTMGRGSLLQPH